MPGESDGLAEALADHEVLTGDYVRVEQGIRDALPPRARTRRRWWLPLAVLSVLALTIPAVVHVGSGGGRRFVPAAASDWPSAANTGPTGSLTAYTGSCTITADDTVIDSKVVSCAPDWLTIQAANVTISNSTVDTTIWLDPDSAGYDGTWSMTVTDSEVDAGDYDLPGICCARWVITRTEMHGGHNGAQCDGGYSPTIDAQLYCTMQDSYVHGQYQPLDFESHLGGFLTDGGVDGIQLIHNNVVCDAVENPVGGGCSGDINLIPNFGPITNILIKNNKFGANATSPYCTVGGEKSVSSWPHSTGVVYQDNVFERGVTGVCAGYGPVGDFNVNNAGNQWINNKYDDGTTVDPE